MKGLILFLALLTASPALAGGPELLFAAALRCPPPATTINGIEDVSTSELTDTGTESRSTPCGDTISVHAICGGGTGSATVLLVVNGSVVASASAGTGAYQDTTLTYPVTGAYTVRVYGVQSGSGTFIADTFSVP